ncbi:MAG: tetratricopeptide repeat protein [Elusimicrobia bacterium]|nr:tetratricopeptide repeat protein [Elusimicrobiota bacterium]
MQKITRIPLLVLGIVFYTQQAYSLPWRILHEIADAKTQTEAERAVSNNPDSLDDQYILALVYLTHHKNQEALDIFSILRTKKTSSIEGTWGTAEVLRRFRDHNKSKELLKTIMETNKEFAPAYITLAYIKYIELDLKETIRLAAHVIDLGRANVDLSNYVRAHLIVGGAKGMRAYYGGPIAKVIHGLPVKSYLNKAQELQPNNPGVYFGLGSYYLLSPGIAGGDLEKAEEYIRKAIDKDPLFADAYVRLAQVFKRKGNQEKFEEYIQKALDIDPDNELANDIQKGLCRFICVSEP